MFPAIRATYSCMHRAQEKKKKLRRLESLQFKSAGRSSFGKRQILKSALTTATLFTGKHVLRLKQFKSSCAG